ncbi:cell growth regulator with EF hand domain protein 1 [Pithys albifrons albifrons]|uniref:cell growth regulator with EF hand domain protein 1 n=1 Tax=Pithys albifrons albifrons TaxID=3385563 RepID=UPI003A5CF581
MRSKPVTLTLLLLLLGPPGRAAPRAGGHRPEPSAATIPDVYPDPLSPESLALPLLQRAVQSLGLPGQDVEAMTWEQALLYLVVLHDHDRSGRLDGLELLQLLGTVLAQAGGHPDPDMVAVLVDRALARQDLNGDGLLDPHELLDPPKLLSPERDQGPLRQSPPKPQAGLGAVPEEATEMPRGNLGLSSPEQAAPVPGAAQAEAAEDADREEDENSKVESPNVEAMEAEEAPEAEASHTSAIKEAAPEDEAPHTYSTEEEAPEGEAAPAWRDSEEG